MNTTPLIGQLIRVDTVDIPPEYERPASLIEDDALRQSIENSGVQQPVVVFSKGDGRYGLIDGGRRIEIAKFLNLHTIPAVIDELPAGVDPREYQDRLRFVLDEHRQDLFPSQRAALIDQLKRMFNMTNRDVAAYLGVDPGSVTNWNSVLKYAEPIRKAIDTGEINLHAARSFDGLKPEAQLKVFKALRHEFQTMAGGKLHRLVRSKYSPTSHPELYTAPEKTKEKMARQKKGRRSKRRTPLTRDAKKALAVDLEVKETELRDNKEELLQLKREITLATQPIRGILRSKTLKEMIPTETLEELEVFAERYV